MPRSSLLVAILVASGLLASNPAAGAQARRTPTTPAEPKPFLDTRTGERAALPGGAPRSARRRLRSAGAAVTVDARTGTVRFLAGRAAPLSPAAAGDRLDIAERYVRNHLTALGLSRADLGSLALERRTGIPDGALLLGYRQYADGIPSFDGGMRIMVDARGRVRTVAGAAQRDLSVTSTVPKLSATEAMRRLMDNVGVRRSLEVAAGPSGLRRTTRFTSGEAGTLVVFGQGASARLAWQ